jgi:hypothetical protein
MVRRPGVYLNSQFPPRPQPFNQFFQIGAPNAIQVSEEEQKEREVEQEIQDLQKSENELWSLGDMNDIPIFENDSNDPERSCNSDNTDHERPEFCFTS